MEGHPPEYTFHPRGVLFAHWTSISRSPARDMDQKFLLFIRFSSLNGLVLCCHPGASSSPVLSSWQEMFIEEAFLSLFNSLLAAPSQMRTSLARRTQAPDLYSSHTERKKITKGERKCRRIHGLAPTPFLMKSVYIYALGVKGFLPDFSI